MLKVVFSLAMDIILLNINVKKHTNAFLDQYLPKQVQKGWHTTLSTTLISLLNQLLAIHVWKWQQKSLFKMLKLHLQRRSSTSLVSRRTKCSSNISCVTWLS